MSKQHKTQEEIWYSPYTKQELEQLGWSFVGESTIGRECEQYFGISIEPGYDPLHPNDPVFGNFTLGIWYYESVEYIPIPMRTFEDALYVPLPVAPIVGATYSAHGRIFFKSSNS